jgi:hypothetical protein
MNSGDLKYITADKMKEGSETRHGRVAQIDLLAKRVKSKFPAQSNHPRRKSKCATTQIRKSIFPTENRFLPACIWATRPHLVSYDFKQAAYGGKGGAKGEIRTIATDKDA